MPPPARFVRVWEHGPEFLEHRDGVPWNEAPMPRASHCCHPQTRAVARVSGLPLMLMSRCRCGGVNLHDDEGWIDRMSRNFEAPREDGLTRVPRAGRLIPRYAREESVA